MRRNRARLASSAAGLSLSQLSLLESVTSPMTVGEIAAQAGVSGPSATRMLQGLERDGIVPRQRSPHDERKVLVDLTPHGSHLVARQRAALLALQREHYASLTPTQREVF